jgi:putative ABC transport system permease protein
MRRSLRSWLWRVPIDQEVEEELAFHLEMRRREGKPIDPADVARVRRACVEIARRRDREMRLMQWFGELRGDVRFALRQLRKAPGFTVVAALTLALGIGANSAIFALVDATLLRPVPFDEPDRLVMVSESLPRFPRTGVSSANFDDWEARNRTFESMAGVFAYARRVTMPDGKVDEIAAQQVTHRFFDVLRIRPIAGRTFRPEDKALPPNATVISERLWRTRFGSDPSIVGRLLRIDGLPFTVLGIVPAEFQFFAQADLWTVWHELPGMDPRGLRFLRGFGRLKPGVSIEAAQSDMSTIAAALEAEYPEVNKDRGANVEPMSEVIVDAGVQRNARLFLGVVGFVLLMCCANVANLLLARMSGRARELAIRSSLGAGRGRIVTQLMTESLVLAMLGGVLGMGVGYAILQAAPSLLPPGLLPASVTLSFDGRVVAFCVAASLLVGVLFGLAPTWQSTGTRLVQVMTAEGRGNTRAGGRFRSVLVVAEVAAAVLLLCGAGLLLRSLSVLGSVDGGARADSALTMQVALSYGLPQSRHKTLQSMADFYRDVERDVAALPGVRGAGWGSGLPLGGVYYGGFNVTIEGQPGEDAGNRPAVDYMIVSPGYLDALGVPVVAGRPFDDRDTASSTPVALVSSDFVIKHLGGRNPIGVRVTVPMMGLTRVPPVTREIVGVVAPIRPSPDGDDTDQLYVPVTQNAWANSVLVVRPRDAGAASALASAVRAVIARVDPEQPVTRVQTLDEVAWRTVARPRFRATLVATFAGLALLLAMIGVFGVLAYAVQQRWREFGVRIALGASAGHVLMLVAGSAARVIGAGIVIGIALAAVLSRFIAVFLFGVQPWDVVTFGAVVCVLALTGAIAALAPALRAARVDPVVAFRND